MRYALTEESDLDTNKAMLTQSLYGPQKHTDRSILSFGQHETPTTRCLK